MDDLDAGTLDAFFSYENGPGLCDHIAQMIEKHQRDDTHKLQHIDLNLFELDIDHSAGTVLVQEICAPCRELLVPLQDFVTRLKVKRRF